MNTKLYVGNLSFDTTENDLQDLFAACGPVSEVNLIMDRSTNRPRGFAFVTMATPEGAQAAIAQVNGKSIQGRAITSSIFAIIFRIPTFRILPIALCEPQLSGRKPNGSALFLLLVVRPLHASAPNQWLVTNH